MLQISPGIGIVTMSNHELLFRNLLKFKSHKDFPKTMIQGFSRLRIAIRAQSILSSVEVV